MTTTAIASSTPRSAPWSVALVVGPPVLAFGVVAAILVCEAFGVHPWASPRPATVSEAAAVGEAYQAIDLIRQGQDPNGVAHVRAGLIDRDAYNVTPIDGASLGRRAALIPLLRANGARVINAPQSICLAHAVGMSAAVPLLADDPGSTGDEPSGPAKSATEALRLCEAQK